MPGFWVEWRRQWPGWLDIPPKTFAPNHGYAIMADIETFADVRLGPGTLYTAITRLVQKKPIASQASFGE